MKTNTSKRSFRSTAALVESLESRQLYSATTAFASFSALDASRDASAATIFQNGVLRVNYKLVNASDLAEVKVYATNGAETKALSTLTKQSVRNHLIGLGALSTGQWSIFAMAKDTASQNKISPVAAVTMLPTVQSATGDFSPQTFSLNSGTNTAHVFRGRGGTDTLQLNVARSEVVSLNGQSLGTYADPNPHALQRQAIYRGTAYDFVTLSDGREIYFQGIENLSFSSGNEFELQRRTDDTWFGNQWNLHTTDVTGAWRFTRGSSGVLIASLDTGLTLDDNGNMIMNDLDSDRLITDEEDAESVTSQFGHGHKAISVMSSTPNNASGVAGINWKSDVIVHDVYDNDATNLMSFIEDTVAFARENNKKVVFQGGIQTDFWLETSGYTQEQLEEVITESNDVALYAIAATNGGPGGGVDDPDYLTSVAGVARLAATHDNVISVGALQWTNWEYENNLLNATGVDLAAYSNRGWNLSLVAPTDSPAMDIDGSVKTFGGTSCANPNLAGIASLVWSVKKALKPSDVKNTLTSFAMDLGTSGRDDTFGAGLVDADASVRRAWALKRDPKLARTIVLPSALMKKPITLPGRIISRLAPEVTETNSLYFSAARNESSFSSRSIENDSIDTSCEDIVTAVA